MKNKACIRIMSLMLAAALCLLPVSGVMNEQIEQGPARALSLRAFGGDYVITQLKTPDWHGKTYTFGPDSSLLTVSYGLPGLIDVRVNEELVTGVTHPGWTWKNEGQPFDPSEHADALPAGTYTLTVALDGREIWHSGLSETITVSVKEGVIMPSITVVVRGDAQDVTHDDYRFVAGTGKLTVLSDAGMTGWKNAVWPSELRALIIDSEVTSIPDSAFSGCYNLKSVDFMRCSVTSIGSRAFQGCTALTKISIPDSVESFGIRTFAGCSALTQIGLTPASQLTDLGQGTFDGCVALESLFIPAGVTDEPVGDVYTSKVFGNDGLFDGCEALESITVHGDNSYFKVQDGMVISKTNEALLYCPRDLNITEYTIPADIKIIGGKAFRFHNHLTKVTIHADVTHIEGEAFQRAPALVHVDIADDSKLKYLGDNAFEREGADYVGDDFPYLDLFLPRSLTDSAMLDKLLNVFVDMDEPTQSATIRLSVYYGSVVAQWCAQADYPYYFRPDSIELQANPPELMYKYVPYLFTPQTTIPTNEDLFFWLEDTSGNRIDLPQGLMLYDGITYPQGAPAGLRPGAIYGAPLDYTAFIEGVKFVMKACNKSDVNRLYPATATFVIKLAATPDNAGLEQTVNKYPFIPDPVTGDDGRIADSITGDRSSYTGDQVLHIDGPFKLFDSFWLNGVRLELKVEYNAEDGSTTVTVFEKTIKSLENGSYTAAAAFRTGEGSDTPGIKNSELNVVAQNFTINLTASGGPGQVEPADTVPAGGGGDTQADLPGPDDEQEEPEPPVETPEIPPTQPDEPPAETQEPPAPDTQEPAPETPGQDTDSDTPGPTAPVTMGGTGGGTTAPGGDTDDSDDTQADETPPTTQPPPATEASGGETDTTQAESGTGTLLVGLEADAQGNLFFEYDGETPLELRIDMPFETFEGITVNGQPWSLGTDYTARSGSTVISVPVGTLAQLGEGLYTLSAQFQGGITAAFTFTLIKPAAEPEAGEAGGLPTGAILLIIAAVLLGGGVTTAVVMKKRAAR